MAKKAEETTPGSLVPARRSLSLFIHAAGLVSSTATFLWLPHTTNPLHRGAGGPFQFLAVISRFCAAQLEAKPLDVPAG
ncbi:uncharacterized protein PG998_011957 [Apiospora kogelbergensis]|uniref:uncharacterized protein n=1 Tax=Apiospora kogelbergensis TaxID=1337665 RepID=UPI00312E01DC